MRRGPLAASGEPVPRVREGVQRILDTITPPAYARNGRMDILAANRLGRALFTDVLADGTTGSTSPATCSSTPARRTSTAIG